MSEAKPRPTAPAVNRVHAAIGRGLLFLGLWGSLMSGPSAADIGLDSSWKLILQLAAHDGWQLGPDIIFTFGPLGYLLHPADLGLNHVAILIGEVFGNLGIALVVYVFGRRLAGVRQVYYFLFFILLAASLRDTLHLLIILMLGCDLLTEKRLKRPGLLAVSAGFAGVLALIKFPNLLLASGAVTTAAAWMAWAGRWRALACAVTSFLLTFLGGWVLAGQSPDNLPSYVVRSFELSSGYVASMFLDAAPSIWWCGILALVAIAAFYAFHVITAIDRPRALAAVLIAAACSFIGWKHGFVRADAHVMTHFTVCLFLAVSYPALLPGSGHRRRSTAAVTLAGSTAFLGICLQNPAALLEGPSTVNARIVNNFSAWVDLPGYRDGLVAELQRRKAAHRLEILREKVGDSTVDLLGHDQATLILNDLNYTPRPTLQSYAAMTAGLMRLNQQHLASAAGPDLLLYKVETIDNRLPSLDDSLSIREMFRHYRFEAFEDGFLRFARTESRDPALETTELLEEIMVGWNETITAPDAGESAVWCELEIRPSLLGAAQSLLYKLPLVTLDSQTDGGLRVEYRLPITMAGAGFPTSPHLTSNQHVLRYQHGGAVPRLESFSLRLPEGGQSWFDDQITVRFYRMAPYPRAFPDDAAAGSVGGFAGFSHAPDAIEAVYEPSIIVEDNHNRLFAHPPSRLRFDLGEQSTRLRGHYGFFAGAFTGDGKTDGAQFVVEWTDADGNTTELLNRSLDPLHTPAERADQTFDLSLPPGRGQVTLVTREGAAGDISFDWVYWADVVIE